MASPEPTITITVEVAEQIMHVIDLSMPFWEEGVGLVDASEMSVIRGMLEDAIQRQRGGER